MRNWDSYWGGIQPFKNLAQLQRSTDLHVPKNQRLVHTLRPVGNLNVKGTFLAARPITTTRRKLRICSATSDPLSQKSLCSFIQNEIRICCGWYPTERSCSTTEEHYKSSFRSVLKNLPFRHHWISSWQLTYSPILSFTIGPKHPPVCALPKLSVRSHSSDLEKSLTTTCIVN